MVATRATLTKEAAVMIPETDWEEVGMLPSVLSVDLALIRFTVGDLLQLAPGTVLESENPSGADVPLVVNTQVIGWAEFEVVNERLAVRVTELA
jgi:flagellar motor switch protein FliN/FliY